MKKLACLIVLFVVFVSKQAYCQNENTVINNAVTGLKTLSGDHIIEKAYLHFDRPYYVAGDTIYFKAYVTLGEHYDLSGASNVLHVDLIDPAGSIVSSIRLQLVNGVAWGDFSLPYSFAAGSYRVRAYTRYMENDPDYFFDKTIAVGSRIVGSAVGNNSALTVAAKPDLQFFPEGGELVNAVISKVAFKAVNVNGLGINVKGTIVDNANNPVSTFVSSHLGMGTFYFLPEEGKTYKANVVFGDGTHSTFSLPAAKSKGILLAVKDTLGKMSVEVRSNKPYFEENLNKNISIVIYGSGTVNTVSTKLDSRRLSLDIPNSQFPSGVVQVTLFSETGEPLSERLLFLKNPDLVNLTLTGNKSSYTKREKVSFTLNAKDKGIGTSGHFSVAVVDENKIPFDDNNETTILTYLLLTSAVKGYIEQPNYYFINNNDQSAADLDALMLTQGYRRFTWKELLNDGNAKFNYEPEKNLEISGTAKTASGAPVVDMDVMLLSTNKSGMLGDRTDSKGNFKFANLPPLADGTVLTLQATGSTKARKTTIFTIDPPGPEPQVMRKVEPGILVHLAQTDQAVTAPQDVVYQHNSKNDAKAKDAKLNETEKNDYKSSNLGGSGHADQVINGDVIKNASSLSVGLSGLLHGVSFQNGVPYLNNSTVFSNSEQVVEPMYVILDGSPLAVDHGGIDNINPASVETVELLKGANASIYGVEGGSGVLVITSRQNTPAITNTTPALGNLQFKANGFYVARQFYSPKYDSKVASDNNKPDQRSTIYWNPEVVTDKDGNAGFDYYNSDGTGVYRVVVEGIDAKGNIGRQVYSYKVE